MIMIFILIFIFLLSMNNLQYNFKKQLNLYELHVIKMNLLDIIKLDLSIKYFALFFIIIYL